MYEYVVLVEYYDKNKAQRLIRKKLIAKNKKQAVKKLVKLGHIINITWEQEPNISEDLQLELFEGH